MLIFKRNKKSIGVIFSLLLALGIAYKTESNLSYPTNSEAFSPIDTAYAGGDGGDGGGGGAPCDSAGTGAGCDGDAYAGAFGDSGGGTPYSPPPEPTVQVNFN